MCHALRKANLRPDNDGLEPLTGLNGTRLQQSGINNTKNKNNDTEQWNTISERLRRNGRNSGPR